MRKWPLVVILSVLASCAPVPTRDAAEETTRRPTATLLFAGDVMLGRRVAPVARAEGPGLLEGIRFVASSADLALANLESPLTNRPHLSDSDNVLEADPDLAGLLAGAGFDGFSLANNHSGDAGPEGVRDTLEALSQAGLFALGAGTDRAGAEKPLIIDADGVTVALLAFDVTGLGLAATEAPGVAVFDPQLARRSVERAAGQADVVVVSIHGGVEYLPDTDPILEDVGRRLVGWGADVIWGHGSHVAQPVIVAETADGDVALLATSLGNLLFDQQRPSTQTGAILEVLVSEAGVEAFRVGRASHESLRVGFDGWDLPAGSAALLGADWWSLAGSPEVRNAAEPAVGNFALGDVVTAGVGDVTGDALPELVVSYRHPFRPNPVNTLFGQSALSDDSGRSAHLGVFDLETMEPVWAAGTLTRPVSDVAVCDGSLALAFDTLDDTRVVGTGAWVWWDFGFVTAPVLTGEGRPACLDVDGDGQSDPVILDR